MISQLKNLSSAPVSLKCWFFLLTGRTHVKVIASLLIFCNIVYSGGDRAPKLALIPFESQNIPVRKYKALSRELRNQLIQSNYFKVVSHEKLVYRLSQSNQPLQLECYKDVCLRQTGKYLPEIKYLLVGRLTNDNHHLELKLKLFSNKHKMPNFETSVKLEMDDTAYQRIIPESVKKFNKLLLADSLSSQGKDHVNDVNIASIVLAGTVLAGVGIATAWRGGQLEGEDNNSTRVNGIRSHPSNLSSIRGFFALPSIAAAYKGQGGAGVASVEGSVSTMMNPAGLTRVDRTWVNYSFSSLPGGVPSFFLGFASPLSDNLFQALAIRHEGDELANEMTLYSSFATNLGNYFRSIQNLKTGINLKGYLLSVGEGGTGLDRSTGYGYGMGIDLGLQFPITHKIEAGVMVRDIYSYVYNINTLTNKEYAEPLPGDVTLGFAYRVSNSLTLAIDGEKALFKDQVDHIRLGGTKKVYEILSVRLGTSQIINKENSRYITFGFGFNGDVENYSLYINYSFEHGIDNTTTLSNQHQFSMDMGF